MPASHRFGRARGLSPTCRPYAAQLRIVAAKGEQIQPPPLGGLDCCHRRLVVNSVRLLRRPQHHPIRPRRRLPPDRLHDRAAGWARRRSRRRSCSASRSAARVRVGCHHSGGGRSFSGGPLGGACVRHHNRALRSPAGSSGGSHRGRHSGAAGVGQLVRTARGNILSQ